LLATVDFLLNSLVHVCIATYLMLSMIATYLMLSMCSVQDLVGADSTNGKLADIWDCVASPSSQQWYGPNADSKNAILLKSACTQQAGCTACIDLNGGQITNGNKIQIWECSHEGTHQNSQAWEYDTETLQIKYLADPTKCIDVPGGDMSNGNKLWLCKCVVLGRWRMSCVSFLLPGTDIMLPCMTLQQPGDCNNHTSQQWKGGGAYQWVNQKNTNMCLDLYGLNTTSGNFLEIWVCEKLAAGEATPVHGKFVGSDSHNSRDRQYAKGPTTVYHNVTSRQHAVNSYGQNWGVFGRSQQLAYNTSSNGLQTWNFDVNNVSAYINHESTETPMQPMQQHANVTGVGNNASHANSAYGSAMRLEAYDGSDDDGSDDKSTVDDTDSDAGPQTGQIQRSEWQMLGGWVSEWAGSRRPQDFMPPVLPSRRNHPKLKLGSKFECLNDGTCGPSDDPVRAKWSTGAACTKECGSGKWACKKGKANHGFHYCTPDAAGTAATGSAGACETACKA
jgi:hypothetical protein